VPCEACQLQLFVRPLLFWRGRPFRCAVPKARTGCISPPSALGLAIDAQAPKMSTLGVTERRLDASMPVLQLLAATIEERDHQSMPVFWRASRPSGFDPSCASMSRSCSPKRLSSWSSAGVTGLLAGRSVVGRTLSSAARLHRRAPASSPAIHCWTARNSRRFRTARPVAALRPSDRLWLAGSALPGGT